MGTTATNSKWLNSQDTKKALKLSDCQLMHQRLAGKLKFKKVGNAYFYLISSEKDSSS